MEENTGPGRKCAKCHGPIPDSRNKSAQYCDNTCKEAAMKRRRRGVPIADSLPAEAALQLTNRVTGLETTLARTSSELVRARDSRDKHRARVRSLEAALAAERRRAEAVITEQATKTATIREESTTLQRQLLDATTQDEEPEKHRPDPPPPTAAADGGASAEANDVIAKLQQRLAEGNAAYTRLTRENEELRKTSAARDRTTSLIEQSWDRLCRKLYQTSRGRPLPDTEREILAHWITWKNDQHHKKTQQQTRQKAARK